MNFDEKIYKLCKQIPKGKVTTYKELAHALNTKAYRAIGQAMRRNIYAPVVPCHRVVASDGSLHGFEGKTKGKSISKKKRMLIDEGITFIRKKVDLSKHLHKY